MLADADLKAQFQKLCTAMVPIESAAKLSAAIEKVYGIVLTKVLHSRYGQIVKDWRNDNVKSSEKSTLRAPLKVSEASKKKKAKTETTDKKAPRPPAASTVTPEMESVAESTIESTIESTMPAEEKLPQTSPSQPQPQPQLHIDFDNLPPRAGEEDQND